VTGKHCRALFKKRLVLLAQAKEFCKLVKIWQIFHQMPKWLVFPGEMTGFENTAGPAFAHNFRRISAFSQLTFDKQITATIELQLN